MSVNKCTLLGNVGKDPEIRTTKDGKKMASFTLATSDVWKDKKSGEKREATQWHRVVMHNEVLVGIVERYVAKGSKLYLEGAIQTRKWQDNSGKENYVTQIILQGFNCKLEILDGRNNQSENVESQAGSESSGIEESDIPF